MTAREHSEQPPDGWLAALHEAVVADVDAGHTPFENSMPPQEFAAVHDCLKLVERVRRARLSGDPTPEIVAQEPCEQETLSETEDTMPLQRLGRFRILRELGRGGHGIVFLAEDETLGREVALKVPKPECLLSRRMRLRFLREAQAAARLAHPNLLAIYESGEDKLLCYLAMAYCRGPSLLTWVRSQAKPITERAAAQIVAALADGVAYAHDRGVWHRDIKPSNVFLDVSPQGFVAVQSFGSETWLCVPKLGDFGLAQLTDDSGELTGSGALIGTPAYMAPEQARGLSEQIGPATDVYALGTVLFEILTGRPPFQGRSDADTLRQVVSDEAPLIRRHRPKISGDLEAICRRCLEKLPARRYSSAAELAADLQRFLRGEPTLARPVPMLERVAKWTRRNRAWSAVMALAAVAAISFVALLLWSNIKIGAALASAQLEREQTRRYAYGADMRLAQENWDQGLPAESLALLEKYRPRPGEVDFRGIEWHYLWQSTHRDSRVVAQQPTPVWSLAVSPSNRIFATGDPEGVLRVWQLHPPRLLRQWQAHEVGHVGSLEFLPDERTLVSAGDDHTIRFWNVQTGDSLRVLREHGDRVGALALAPDKQQLASGGDDGRVLLWDAHTGELIRELPKHQGAVRWLTFHPVQPWIASGSEDGEVRLWDYQTQGIPLHIPEGKLEPRIDPRWRQATFAPGARGALVASDGSNLLHWQVNRHHLAGQIVLSELLPSKILSFAMLPDATITGHEQPPEIIIRSEDGKSTNRLVGHSDAVRCLAPLRDDQEFLSGSEDRTVRLWRPKVRQGTEFSFAAPASITSVGDSAEGCLALGLENGQLLLFQSLSQSEPRSVSGFESSITKCEFAKGQPHLLVINSQGSAWWLNTLDLSRVRAFQLPVSASNIQLDADATRLAFGVEKTLHLVDAQTGAAVWQLVHPKLITGVAMGGSTRVITTCADGIVRLIDGVSGSLLAQSATYRSIVLQPNLSRDRSRLAIACDKTIRILDTATLQELACLGRSRPPVKISFFDHDRRMLFVDDREMEIVDPETGQMLFRQPSQYPAAQIKISDDDVLIAPKSELVDVFSLRPGGVTAGAE